MSNEAENSNLALWESVQTTDPSFTKPITGLGYNGTTIAPQYLFKRATEAFGPIGIGWGYEIDRSEIIDTHYMKGERDGQEFDYGGHAKVHTCQVTVWYMHPDIKGRHTVTGIGHTKFIYLGKYGLVVDWEYEKKSVTDAITKALSFIGFGADVRLGMFEDPAYMAELTDQTDMAKATDKNVEQVRQREDFLVTLNKTMELMRTSTRLHELSMIYNEQLALVERKGQGSELHDFRTLFTERVNELQQTETANG